MPHDDFARRPRSAAGARRREPSRPDAYSFMSCETWLEFHRELTHVLDGVRTRTDGVTPDSIRLRNGSSLSIRPLVEHCHRRPRDDWRALIGRFVSRGVELLGTGGALPATPSTIDLRVRLVPASPLDHPVLESIGARRVTEDLAAVIVVATDRGHRALTGHDIDLLGWDDVDVWGAAWQQTGRLESPEEVDAVDVGGLEFVQLFGASELTASLVVSLERFVGPLGEHGAVVGVPCDHAVLVHPILGAGSRPAIGTLVPIVRRLHAAGPGSLSPQIYWWQEGHLTWIPTVFGGEVNEVYLPAGLGRVLS